MRTCHVPIPKEEVERERSETSEFIRLLKKALAAIIIGIPLFIVGILGYTEVKPGWNQLIWILVGILVFFVMRYSGGHFFTGAWKAFKAHKANMHTLIALATGPAWVYSFLVSLWPTLFPQLARHVYFDAPLTVIGLIVLGAATEMRVSEKAIEATKKMALLQPAKTHLKVNDRSEEIATENVKAGAVIQVLQGENIPVDGEIVEGSANIDEAKLTGVQTAVLKKIGDRVYAGTNNPSAPLIIKATTDAKQSTLLKIIDMIKQAQNSKPDIAKVSDRIASYFAPLVIIFALVTPLMWLNFGPSPVIAYMLMTFMAVLLIACPCALGLAASISITVGVGKAAEFGILFRNGDAFTVTRKLSALVINQSLRDTPAAVTRLQKMGIQVISWAESTGKLSIEEKTAKIRELKQQGAVIGVTSDGIHDLELLQEADVSFALGIQSYAAENADVAILNESAFALVDAIAIARKTIRNIIQNLTGAFFYNTIGLPLAAGVFYPVVHHLLDPIIAAILMAGSSIAVISNANRLHLFRPAKRGA